MSTTMNPNDQLSDAVAAADETVRCFACRQVWPRAEMRWGSHATGPVWLPKTVRVLRCPDCLPDHAP